MFTVITIGAAAFYWSVCSYLSTRNLKPDEAGLGKQKDHCREG